MSEMKTTTRLSGEKADFVAHLKQPDTAEAVALYELTGTTTSESIPNGTLVGAVIEAGIQAIKEKAEQVGYARLAEFLKTDPEHQAWRDSRRKRARMRSTETLA